MKKLLAVFCLIHIHAFAENKLMEPKGFGTTAFVTLANSRLYS